MQFFANIRNTCFECGTPCDGVYAPNRDVARSGGGVCERHAGTEPEPNELDATDAAVRFAKEAGVALRDVATWLDDDRRIGQPDVRAFLKVYQS